MSNNISNAKKNKSKKYRSRTYFKRINQPFINFIKMAAKEDTGVSKIMDYKNPEIFTFLSNGQIPKCDIQGFQKMRRRFAKAIKIARFLSMAPYLVKATS